MRAMHTPLGLTLLTIGADLVFLLLASTRAALLGLTLVRVRQRRAVQPPSAGGQQ